MKRIITLVFIMVLVPFVIFSQEPAPTEPSTETAEPSTGTTESETETSEPESFFNDLIKTLNPNADSIKKTVESPEEIPVPEPLPVPEEDKTKSLKEDLPDQENPSAPVPTPVTPVPVTIPQDQSETPASTPVKEDVAPVPSDDTPAEPVVAPETVPSQEIVIGSKDTEKKKKKEKVKKEREPREFVPFIEPPEAKSRAQKKYVKEMEKLPKSRMRLITLDPADHIFSRKFRSPEQALKNPANLGVRAELPSSFSIIPINTLELDLKTSTRPFVFWDEFLTTGELLTPEREDSMIAMLGPNGLELPLDINMPTVLNLKMNLLGGSIFANAGLFIQERSRIPGELFGIILDGATFDDPFEMNEELGIGLTAYAKGSAGYGTFYELPSVFGELRFGATVNAYTGVFSSVNITNLELTPSMEGVTLQGSLQATAPLDTLSLFGPDGFSISPVDDLMGIPNITLGYDFGLAWRFKLNRILPFAPKILKNYFDFQIGVEDLGASISMNHAYVREINFSLETDDLLSTFEDFSLDSMVVLDETIIAEDSTISMPLGSKLNMSLHYQPIPQLMLKGGITSFLSDGLNSNSGQNYFYGVEIYPVSSLCIHGSVTQKGDYRFSEAGIKLYSQKSEFGLKLRIYDLDFSLTENLSGAGLQLNWVRYF